MYQSSSDFQSSDQLQWPEVTRPTGPAAENRLPEPGGIGTYPLVTGGHKTRVKVPMRLIDLAHYSDVACKLYIKLKALALRPEGCTAGVRKLALYTGLSVSSVERGLRELRLPGPDGVVELPENTRRTLPGGRGTTARRRVRPIGPRESYVWIPVHASEILAPRPLRAYAAIAYAVVQRIPLTLRHLADFLRHHTGHRAGSPISRKAVREVVASLVRTGWIVTRRRQGLQGRTVFEVNDSPLPSLEPSPDDKPPSGHPDDGSGGAVGEGSLAYKEDPRTDRPENKPPLPSAVGALQVVGATDRHTETLVPDKPAQDRDDGSALRADGPSLPVPEPAPGGNRVRKQPSSPIQPPAFSRTTHLVLEPVRFLLAGVRGYVLRRMAAEIDRQLTDGTEPERLQARLTARLAGTMVSDIDDAGRWLLGVGLPRWGCADPACESGTIWHTGLPCRACQEIRFLRSRDRLAGPLPKPGPPVPPRPCCPVCGRPHRPGNEGVCADCVEEQNRPSDPPSPPGATPGGEAQPENRCRGQNGRCTRTASMDGMCWRCRTGTPERTIPLPRRRFSAQDHLASRRE